MGANWTGPCCNSLRKTRASGAASARRGRSSRTSFGVTSADSVETSNCA